MPRAPILPAELSKLIDTMSASRPAVRNTRGEPPPIMILGPPSWTAAGTAAMSVTLTCSPRWSNSSPAKNDRSSSTYSIIRSIRTPARSMSSPMAWYSLVIHPAPTPASRRPSDSRSMVASDLASTTGWW